MDSMMAFAMGEANRGKDLMVFDWDKAAEIIKKEKPIEAVAGLSSDMEWTSGTIFSEGKPVQDCYTFLSSTWATPVLVLDDNNEIPCYKMQSEVPEWDSHTKWPESSLRILATENKKEDQQ